jgi:hypothetical protein
MEVGELLSRLYPKSFREKTRVDYDFDFDNETWRYNLVIRNTMKKSWWLQLIRKFNLPQSGQDTIDDGFEVENQRLKDTMKSHLRPTIEKIMKDVRNDSNIPNIKTLKLLTCNCDKIIYKAIDTQTVRSEITMSGICGV